MGQQNEHTTLRRQLAIAESRLRATKARQQSLLNSLAQAFWETDASGVVVTDSPSWRNYTGQTVEEMLGYGWLDAIHPDDRAYAEQQWREAVEARTLLDSEFRLRAPDGGWRWTNVRAAPVLDDRGAIEQWVGMNIDITARRHAEQMLRDSEERLRGVLDGMGEGFGVIDPSFTILEYNSEALRMDGRPKSEIVGRSHWEAFPGTEHSEVGLLLKKTMANRQPAFLEHRYRWEEGRASWLELRVYPLADGALAVFWRDVTERRAAEDLLRESEERFAQFAGSTTDVLWIRDADTMTLEYISPAFESVFGVATGAVEGGIEPGAALVDPADRDRVTEHLDAARRGEPQVYEFRIVHGSEGGTRWVRDHCFPLIDESDRVARIGGIARDVTELKLAEAARRESEERQAFLLSLSDAVRLFDDPLAIQNAAMSVLGRQLGAFRAQYFEAEADGDHVNSVAGYSDPPETFVSSRIRMDDFGSFVAADFRAGRTVVVADTAADPRVSAADLQSYQAWGMGAYVAVPLVKDGRFVVCVGVHNAVARYWTDAEISLIQETAERTWASVERARAEAALRASEGRFAQFANASAAGLWIRTADTLAMEYISPAIATIYGVDADALLGDVTRWAALIVPDDRDAALGHLEEARAGSVPVHEFRIQRPSDGAFRWIRNTDFPLQDNDHITRIGGIAEDVTEAKLAVEHQGVLLAELQHRVRNIMAMIRSMVRRSANGATDVADYEALLEGRLLALARVQTLLTRQANSGGSLRDIVESEVSAQAHHGGQFELVGPDVHLSPKAVEVLTLALHELATNALKYGALSTPAGRLRVEWAPFEKRSRPWLAIDWVETGAPPRGPVTRRGFGSDLIEGKIPYELGGTGRITIEPGGARCRLEFPLKEGESILETDAPSPTTIFGGVLDMAGAPDLTGRSVLVVEDDYYIAGDTAAALRGAGAAVLGPCPSEDATLDLLETETPTHAVLDLNLGGGGPSFAIAHALRARGVPFVFLTGYDPDAVPPELSHVVRLQKPVPFRAIVEAVGEL